MMRSLWLWIAFRIVFLLMIPNPFCVYPKSVLVVNCFQNCIFTYDSQHECIVFNLVACCELLSELYFYLWFPTLVFFCLYWSTVVNCFQNCIFTYDSQPSALVSPEVSCCELLSELYFYLWFPTTKTNFNLFIKLWIAFRIVFLLMIPNFSTEVIIPQLVVNCFQNCIFTYDSQRTSFYKRMKLCCELLSELYFYLWFPTWGLFMNWTTMLWIAFRIVFLLMIPNNSIDYNELDCVVNCFQNCIFTYDSQPFIIVAGARESCELLSELYFYLWFPTEMMKDKNHY